MQTLGNPVAASKDAKQIKDMQAVARSARFRACGSWLPEQAYKLRKHFFVGKV